MAEPQKFRLAGVMGWPVAHSRSPKIHGHWIQKHGLSGAYVLLPEIGRASCWVRV